MPRSSRWPARSRTSSASNKRGLRRPTRALRPRAPRGSRRAATCLARRRNGPMPVAGQTHAQRRRLEVSGVVQGVGFRPFVHRLARRHGMGGFVRNEGGSVLIEVEGDAGALDAFQRELTNGDGPALAHIDAVLETPLAPLGEAGFE